MIETTTQKRYFRKVNFFRREKKSLGGVTEKNEQETYVPNGNYPTTVF